MSSSTTRYQLTVEARNLPRSILFGKPCPYAIVSIPEGEQRRDLGPTEALFKTCDADWTKCYIVETSPTQITPIQVVIMNKGGGKLCECSIPDAYEVFRAEGRQQTVSVGRTEIIVRMDESVKGEDTGFISLHLRGLDIKNLEPGPFGLGRSDPFFEVSKKMYDHTTGRVYGWNVIYRSDHILNHLNPYWKPFSLSMEELCFCDVNWPIRIEVKDYGARGNHEIVGEIETTVAKLMENISVRGNADRERAFELYRKKDNDEAGNKCGLIVVVEAKVEPDEDKARIF